MFYSLFGTADHNHTLDTKWQRFFDFICFSDDQQDYIVIAIIYIYYMCDRRVNGESSVVTKSPPKFALICMRLRDRQSIASRNPTSFSAAQSNSQGLFVRGDGVVTRDGVSSLHRETHWDDKFGQSDLVSMMVSWSSCWETNSNKYSRTNALCQNRRQN